MTEDQPGPLKQGDQVYVKSVKMHGKVLHARPGDIREPEREKPYEVQITQYFGRMDLELDDRDAKSGERELDLQRKTDRLAAARKRVQEAAAAGGAVEPQVAMEYLRAADDLWQAMGHAPLLVPMKPPDQ